MRKFYLIALAVIIGTALLLIIGFTGPTMTQNGNSQTYAPNRYAVVAAEVNVLTPQMTANAKRQGVMLKFDTYTGKTWILQLHVAGGNEPFVRKSEWLEVGNLRRGQR